MVLLLTLYFTVLQYLTGTGALLIWSVAVLVLDGCCASLIWCSTRTVAVLSLWAQVTPQPWTGWASWSRAEQTQECTHMGRSVAIPSWHNWGPGLCLRVEVREWGQKKKKKKVLFNSFRSFGGGRGESPHWPCRYKPGFRPPTPGPCQLWPRVPGRPLWDRVSYNRMCRPPTLGPCHYNRMCRPPHSGNVSSKTACAGRPLGNVSLNRMCRPPLGAKW